MHYIYIKTGAGAVWRSQWNGGNFSGGIIFGAFDHLKLKANINVKQPYWRLCGRMEPNYTHIFWTWGNKRLQGWHSLSSFTPIAFQILYLINVPKGPISVQDSPGSFYRVINNIYIYIYIFIRAEKVQHKPKREKLVTKQRNETARQDWRVRACDAPSSLRHKLKFKQSCRAFPHFDLICCKNAWKHLHCCQWGPLWYKVLRKCNEINEDGTLQG